jgi:hypothetical protein
MRVESAESVDDRTLEAIELSDYKARVERVAFIDVAAFDWNCPQHITQRYTESEFADLSP